MKHHLIIILSSIILLSCQTVIGQNRYALLIGIGNYPKESGWSAIHGNNDIPIIKSMLLKQNFSNQNIVTLIDSAATKNNILTKVSLLINSVQKGDIVYIHFSGHGQQVSDLDGDEEDSFDEAWVPYDANKKYQSGVYVGQNHIIDDEVNLFLSKLRIRLGCQGKIIVISDSCHSGSGTRGNDNDFVIRGTNERFIIPHKEINIIKKQKPSEWLHVAACKSYQTNYEYKSPGGQYYGVLTYVIAGENKRFDKCKYNDLLKEWTQKIALLSYFPQEIEGEGKPSQKDSYFF